MPAVGLGLFIIGHPSVRLPGTVAEYRIQRRLTQVGTEPGFEGQRQGDRPGSQQPVMKGTQFEVPGLRLQALARRIDQRPA